MCSIKTYLPEMSLPLEPKDERGELRVVKVEEVTRAHQGLLGRVLTKQRETKGTKTYQMHQFKPPTCQLRLTSLGCRYPYSRRFYNYRRRGGTYWRRSRK